MSTVAQNRVVVYSRKKCVQCTATTRMLKQHDIPYDIFDIDQDPAALKEVQGLGYRQMPVVVYGKQNWAGFDPDRLKSIAG